MVDELVDPTALAELRELGHGVVDEVLRTYYSESSGVVSAIAAAASRDAVDEVRRLAHQLKSSSASVGAIALSAAARDLEQKAGDGVMDGSTVHRLMALYDPTIVELQRTS